MLINQLETIIISHWSSFVLIMQFMHVPLTWQFKDALVTVFVVFFSGYLVKNIRLCREKHGVT